LQLLILAVVGKSDNGWIELLCHDLCIYQQGKTSGLVCFIQHINFIYVAVMIENHLLLHISGDYILS